MMAKSGVGADGGSLQPMTIPDSANAATTKVRMHRRNALHALLPSIAIQHPANQSRLTIGFWVDVNVVAAKPTAPSCPQTAGTVR